MRYYPRFTKVIVNFFMTKDQSILRRNKYGAILPVKLANEAIRNLESYKEYYVIASGAEPTKTKVSVRKKKSSSDTIMPPPTAKGKRLKALVKVGQPAKDKKPAKSSKVKGLTVLSEVALTKAEQIKLAIKKSLTQTHISYASGLGADEGTDDDDDEQTDSDNDRDDFVHPKFSTHDEEDKHKESFDLIVQTPCQVKNTDDEDSHDMNVEGDEGANEENEANELYRDVNINLEDVSVMTSPELPLLSEITLPPPSIPIISHVQQTPAPSPANVPSSSLQDLFNFGSLFSIVDKCIDHRMNKAMKVAVRLQSDMLQDEAQAENEDFLNKLDENIQKKIKEQVKEQVKVQVSKILPKIKKTINEQFEAKVLTRSSNSSKTSHAVAADLSELELKNILIDKIESNKSIHKSDEQKNLYKALVNSYEYDKLILDTYGDTVTLKKCRDDEDKDEEPLDQTGGPREDEREKNQSQPVYQRKRHPRHLTTFMMNRLKVDTLTPEILAGPTYKPMKGSCKSLVELELFLEEVYKATTDQLDWNNPEGQ
nr:hypothetical protein [Tanacetum cinerariifolium]